MKRSSVALGLTLLGALGTALAQTPERSAAEQFALTRGRALMLEFYAVNLDGLWNAFTPQVRAQWGTAQAFRAFRERGVREYGAERDIVQERTFTRAGESFYVRSATFEHSPQQVWALVIGFKGLRVTTFGIALEEERERGPVARTARAGVGYGPL